MLIAVCEAYSSEVGVVGGTGDGSVGKTGRGSSINISPQPLSEPLRAGRSLTSALSLSLDLMSKVEVHCLQWLVWKA